MDALEQFESLIGFDFSNVHNHLAMMEERLKTILASHMFDQDAFVEVLQILNNVGYLFLYLEANNEYVNFDAIKTKINTFFGSPEVDAALLNKVDSLEPSDATIKNVRRKFLANYRAKLQDSDAEEQQEQHFVNEMKRLSAQIDQAMTRAGEKLGLNPPKGGSMLNALYALQSRSPSQKTRHSLQKLQEKVYSQFVAPYSKQINGLARMRNDQARRRGVKHALAGSLSKCSVSEEQAERFIYATLDLARTSHVRLLHTVAERLQLESATNADFPFFLKSPFPNLNSSMPFNIDAILAYIFGVIGQIFGLNFLRLKPINTKIDTYLVRRDKTPIGIINLDLWVVHGVDVKVNRTIPMRDRVEWKQSTQLPVAYVACRLEHVDEVRQLHFQNIHALFHELGHAVNHLLVRGNIPGKSGLEYLPLERLEYLSYWFEKWAYHPAILRYIGSDPVSRGVWERCCTIKFIEYQRTMIDRAVLAAVDFELHRAEVPDFKQTFETIVSQFKLKELCNIGEFIEYFSRPMFLAHPGANFIYLWGICRSCEMFEPFHDLTFDQLYRREEWDKIFEPVFYFDGPDSAPTPHVMFEFFQR